MFVLWVLSTCGGGDVKLFTAVGAWLGPRYFVFILGGSLVVLPAVMLLKVLLVGAAPSLGSDGTGRKPAKRKAGGPDVPPKRPQIRVTYSLPVAIATAGMLLWLFRAELKLVAFDGQSSQRAHAHAR
jgi:hypothetical protein